MTLQMIVDDDGINTLLWSVINRCLNDTGSIHCWRHQGREHYWKLSSLHRSESCVIGKLYRKRLRRGSNGETADKQLGSFSCSPLYNHNYGGIRGLRTYRSSGVPRDGLQCFMSILNCFSTYTVLRAPDRLLARTVMTLPGLTLLTSPDIPLAQFRMPSTVLATSYAREELLRIDKCPPPEWPLISASGAYERAWRLLREAIIHADAWGRVRWSVEGLQRFARTSSDTDDVRLSVLCPSSIASVEE